MARPGTVRAPGLALALVCAASRLAKSGGVSCAIAASTDAMANADAMSAERRMPVIYFLPCRCFAGERAAPPNGCRSCDGALLSCAPRDAGQRYLARRGFTG